MEREICIFPSKAIWTHSMAAHATSPTRWLRVWLLDGWIRGQDVHGAARVRSKIRALIYIWITLCLFVCVCERECRHVQLLICSPEQH